MVMEHDPDLLRAAIESDHLFDDSFENNTDHSVSQIVVSDRQYDVITHPCNMNEILSVRAGPGSGKTFTIAARIAHLLQLGMDPGNILVLSMANRSVDALRNSLASIIGTEMASSVDISTFHSFCGLIIDQYSPVLQPSMARRRIFDKKCWYNLAQFFLSKLIVLGNSKLEGHITPLRLDKLLSEVTNGDLSIKDAALRYKINADYIETLVRYLNHHGMMRYGDLVKNALSLIEILKTMERPHDPQNMILLGMPRLETYKAVFVDEFQDMYPSLLSVVKAVVNYPTFGHENTMKHLTISGDPNQSIYEFLGANASSMANIRHVFPSMNVEEKPLAESYRCTQPILDAATNITLRDGDRTSLISNRTPDVQVKPVVLQHPNQESEFAFVADEIVRLICCLGGLIRPKDIAVLTRTNAEAERIQAILKGRFGLRSNKISQGNLWVTSPMHIYRDILSVISGESDSSFSLLNLLPVLDRARGSRLRASKLFSASIKKESGDINFLESFVFDELEKIQDKKGKKATTQNKVRAAADNNEHEKAETDKGGRKKNKNMSTLETLFKNCNMLLENIAQFLNQVQIERRKLHKIHQRDPLGYNPQALAKCLANMARLPGIHEYIFSDQKHESPFSNYLESFNNSLHHSFEGYSARPDLQENLTFVDYFLQAYDNEVPATSNNLVQVSTIHSAKGLEFPIVFVLGTGKYRAYWDSYLEGGVTDEMGEKSNERNRERSWDTNEAREAPLTVNKEENRRIDRDHRSLAETGKQSEFKRCTVGGYEGESAKENTGENEGENEGEKDHEKEGEYKEESDNKSEETDQTKPKTLSSSHLLYVALTRARNLVYLGTGLSWDRMLSSAHRLFACSVPELVTSSLRNVYDKDFGPPIDGLAQTNEASYENGTHQYSYGRASHEQNKLLWGLCKDLNRAYPLHRKLEQGLKSYMNIVNSTPTHVSNAKHVSHPRLSSIVGGTIGPIQTTFNRSKTLMRRV